MQTAYAIVLAEPYNNLDAVWSWLILLAYAGHVCSLVFAKRKFSFAVGLASAVLIFVGALVYDVEFWLIGVVLAVPTAVSAILRN